MTQPNHSGPGIAGPSSGWRFWITAYRPYVTALAAIALVVFLLPRGENGPGGGDGGDALQQASGGAGGAGATGAVSGAPGAAGGVAGGAAGGVAGPGAVAGAAGAGRPGARVGGAGAGGQGQSLKVPLSSAVGVGTKEAMQNPMCDPQTGRLRLPTVFAPPCVKAWPENADNGGKTAPGVTEKTIRIATLQCDRNDSKCFTDQGALGTASIGTDQCAEDRSALRMYNAVYGGFWGRKIEHVCVTTTGFDEAAQRADAIAVASKNVFMVMDFWAGGTVFDTEVAKRGVITWTARTPWNAGDKQPGFRFQGSDDRDLMASSVEVVCKMLNGGNAEYAGNAAFHAVPRKFGLVYPSNPDFPPASKYLIAPLKKCGITPVAIGYDVGSGGVVGDPSTSQQQAPLIIGRLNSQGVNNVIAYADPLMTLAMTNQATSQNYRPEWFQTGFKYQDVLGGLYDQDQWSHAMGLAFPVVVSIDDSQNAPKWQDPLVGLYFWYYGQSGDTKTDCGNNVKCQAGVHLIGMGDILAGLTLAGPNLTPKAFSAGMFSMPVAGGAACDCRTIPQYSYGRHGLFPYNDWMGPDDHYLAWFDPRMKSCTAQTCDGTIPGGQRLLYGGKHFLLGKFPSGKQPWFDKTKAIAGFKTRPKNEIAKLYPCKGCPSSGAAYGPATSSLDVGTGQVRSANGFSVATLGGVVAAGAGRTAAGVWRRGLRLRRLS